MGVPKETAASIELPVTPDLAWQGLMEVAGAAAAQENVVWHFGHADVSLDSVVAGEGAAGTGRWVGIDYQVSAHLVPRGRSDTLLMLAADANTAFGSYGGGVRDFRSRRRARADLEAMAQAVGAWVIARTTDPPR